MCRKASIHQTPDRQHDDHVSLANSIGELFRNHGEAYIKAYKPSQQQIKLIRAIRVCKTPALGAMIIRCKDCGHQHKIYRSCGNSHCMICQIINREKWIDKLKKKLLQVPYMHMIFTLPHQLNSLARQNESKMYSEIMKLSALTVKTIGAQSNYTPGMTAVLHTFGSDMKYHIHVHSLVTFGGLSKAGDWIYPIEKFKLEKYRKICAIYKALFIKSLRILHQKGALNYHQDIAALLAEVQKVRWVVHSTRPTMDTKTIEDYLAKYINRVAVSNSRLDYVQKTETVTLQYNDYKNQQAGQPAPKVYKTMEPLVAIHQIMQHVLPPYFQKSRSYGLHHSATKLKAKIPAAMKRNGQTIRTSFEIITELLKNKPYKCEKCSSENHEIDIEKPDKAWIKQYINLPNTRPPPKQKTTTKTKP